MSVAPEGRSLEQRILEAAEAALLEGGGLDLRLSEIVAETGTSVGTVYNLFGSKAGLIAAVAEDIQREVVEYTIAARLEHREPAWADLIDLYVRFEQVVRSDFRRLLFVGRFLSYTDERDQHAVAIREQLLAGLGSLFLETARFVERLVQTGAIRPVEPFAAAGWIYSSVTGAALAVSHLPPVLGDPAGAQRAIFRTQRQMLAQALLPAHLLDDQGMAPREFWSADRRPSG